jgi:hypothetical protein
MRLIRFFVAAIACALILFSNAYPAAAIGSYKSRPSEGEAKLNKVQEMTDDSVNNPPMTLEEVQKRQQGGLNEVQGAADLEKMKNPENSKGATSFIDEVKGALDEVKK